MRQYMPAPALDCYPHGCPCGYFGDPVKECSCSGQAIARYQKRLSGPLLDRIDIHLAGAERVAATHLAEALQYRPKEAN
jgi:predicted ATPase with chaperone activity